MTSDARQRHTKLRNESGVSSEGVITQPLAPLQEERLFLMHEHRRMLIGLGLVLVGLVLLLLRSPILTLDWFISIPIIIVSGVFFAIALYKQEAGFYFPASILGGLSVGMLFLTAAGPAPVILGLSGGFFLMAFISRSLRLENTLWLLFPATFLFLTSMFLFTIL